MSLSSDLLMQAENLCQSDPFKPRQASLRRSISAAYYALFHAAVLAATECMTTVRSEVRPLLARQFQHKVMKAAARRAADVERQKANDLRRNASSSSPNVELENFASAFVGLQEARHLADYDVGEAFTRTQAQKLVLDAKHAIDSLEQIKSTPAGERLFWEMLLGKLERD